MIRIYNFGDRKLSIADPIPSRLMHKPLNKKKNDEVCCCGHERRYHVGHRCVGRPSWTPACTCDGFSPDATDKNVPYAGEASESN